MKTWKHGIVGILAITALCFTCTLYLNEQGDAGTVTVTITIGGGNAAVDWLGELTPEDLVHTIQLFDEDGEEQYRADNLRYGQKSSFSVTPGFYTFYVEAFYNDDLKATGREERTIYAGKNPAITIQMGPVVSKSIILTGITVEYEPTTEIFPDTTLDTLREGLTVTAHYSDGTTAPVTDYTLSVEGDEFTVGENTVTVHYTEGGITKTHTFTVTVDELTHEHNWVKISETEPTCTTAGTELWECDAIDPPHHEDLPGAPALGHDEGEWHITLAATCIAAGTRELRCTRDDAVLETDIIPIDPDAHDYGEWITTAPTCTTTGIDTRTCSRDPTHKETRNETAIDPNAHNYIWTTITPATCTTAGSETGICSYNPTQHITTRTIPIDLINGHDYQNWTVTTVPTCSEVGEEEAPCARDNNHEKGIRDIPIDPNAHDWGSWTLNVPVDGGETRICSHNNSHKETRSILVFVPGGTFQLGKEVGTAGTVEFEPVSDVTLSDFYIGRHEVTQGQWKAIMGGLPTGMTFVPADFRGDDYPMFNIFWYQMLVFCNRLSIAQDLVPAYRINNSTNPSDWGTPPTTNTSAAAVPWNNVTIVAVSNGYRMPTEAQWEYAAKGGNPLAPGWVGYTWAGSDDPDEVAWYDENSPPHAIYTVQADKVGMKAPNGLGLYDMSGNVSEMCWDWYGNYTAENKIDPMGPATGTNRVARGGYVQYNAGNVRIVQRGQNNPANQNGRPYGFRLVRPAGELEGVSDITASVLWHAGNAPSLIAPTVFVAPGNTVTAQGWQISDDGTSGWTTPPATADMSHNGKYLRYYATIGGTTYYSPNTAVISVISPVGNITAPAWREDTAVSLTAPVTGTPTAQGWQISDDGTDGWTNFTPPSTAAMSHNGKYLRYYATLSGTTYYSPNTVKITVYASDFSPVVTIDMYDSGNDGWDGSGALRIVVNGTELSTGVKVQNTADNNIPSGQRGTNTYTFPVEAGDVVQLYWVAGTYQQENSFIAYYTLAPPDPAFTSSNNNSWSGSNALVYRLRGTMTSIAGGALLGSFTVP